MIRRLAAGFAAAGLALSILAGAPAGALETATFGIDVVDADPEGRLHVPLAAGRETTGQLRVWNAGDQPVTIALSVTAATVDDAGVAALGGDPAPVDWVSFDRARLELAEGESELVTVRVRPPRTISGERRTVAVVAEPVSTGPAPAVLQRLAITTYLEPSGPLTAGLGLLPWVAGALLAAVASVLALRQRRQRRREPAAAAATAATPTAGATASGSAVVAAARSRRSRGTTGASMP